MEIDLERSGEFERMGVLVTNRLQHHQAPQNDLVVLENICLDGRQRSLSVDFD